MEKDEEGKGSAGMKSKVKMQISRVKMGKDRGKG